MIDAIKNFKGKVGLWYQSLDSDEAVTLNADEPFFAASVIKLAVMVEAFRRINEGGLDEREKIEITQDCKLPSCGALTYMHTGLKVQVVDLITLMIILSDNTATNLLIDILGIDNINHTMVKCGVPGIALRRKLFDSEAAARGIENTVTPRGVATILRKLYEGKMVSPEMDARMIEILKNQRLNGKMPFYLYDLGIKIAHKTGEDDGITHDVGIVYTDKPFILVMLGNDVVKPDFDRLIQDTAKYCALSDKPFK